MKVRLEGDCPDAAGDSRQNGDTSDFSRTDRFRGVGGILTGAMAALQGWAGVWRFAYSHSQRALRARQIGLFRHGLRSVGAGIGTGLALPFPALGHEDGAAQRRSHHDSR